MQPPIGLVLGSNLSEASSEEFGKGQNASLEKFGQRAESLLTTNLGGDLRSPEKFGQRAESLLTTNLGGDLRSPEKFGGTSTSENIISTSGFDQLLQSVIGCPIKTTKRSFTKRRR